MADLSPQQKAVVHYINGPLLILAGAGSGKTTLLTEKIAWLVREFGAEPRQITTISANPAAARAMRTRLAERITGTRTHDVHATTFGEFSLGILHERLDALGLMPGFSLYDRADTECLIVRLLRDELPGAVGLATPVQRQIARWKRQRTEPSALVDPARGSVSDIAAWLYRRYQERLAAANAIDRDDLTLKAARLLSTEPGFLSEWVGRVRFLLVDEYEQASACEHELVRLLTTGGALLTAAGDDDQSIGDTAGETLDRLKTDIPGIRVVKLGQSFRSTGRILKAANLLLAPTRTAAEPSSWSEREYGVTLRAIRARSDEHEAECVVASLLDHRSLHNLDYRAYAILFRRADQASTIERALRARRIPYHLRGGVSLFDQVEIRDLLGYLKLLANPRDDNAFLRVVNTPRRAVSRATLVQLFRYAADSNRSLLEAVRDPALDQTLDTEQLGVLRDLAQLMAQLESAAAHTNPARFVSDLLVQLRYEEWLRDTCNDLKLAERRMENVMQIVNLLERRARHQPQARLPELATQLNYAAALDPESDDVPGDGVVLTTIAAAKGCEFKHVYLIGLEEGTLPAAGVDSGENLHGERRLAYVALTRACDSVTFTVAERRRVSGEAPVRQPSRFLAELPTEDLEWRNGKQGYSIGGSATVASPSTSDAYRTPRRDR